MERFELRYVMGHIEVYDENGRFCFSADHVSEAMAELREEISAAWPFPADRQIKSEWRCHSLFYRSTGRRKNQCVEQSKFLLKFWTSLRIDIAPDLLIIRIRKGWVRCISKHTPASKNAGNWRMWGYDNDWTQESGVTASNRKMVGGRCFFFVGNTH